MQHFNCAWHSIFQSRQLVAEGQGKLCGLHAADWTKGWLDGWMIQAAGAAKRLPRMAGNIIYIIIRVYHLVTSLPPALPTRLTHLRHVVNSNCVRLIEGNQPGRAHPIPSFPIRSHSIPFYTTNIYFHLLVGILISIMVNQAK